MTTATFRSARRPRRGVQDAAKGFPGESSWQWHVQLKIERIISPLRIGVLAATNLSWVLAPHPAAALPSLVRAVMVAAALYAALDVVLVFRLPQLIARRPWGSTALDFVFVTAWIYATGGSSSPYLSLALLGAISVPLRNSALIASVATLGYGAVVLAFDAAHAWHVAVYVLCAGWGLTAWAAVTHHDRRRSLRDDLTGCFSREYADFRLNDVFEKNALPVAVAIVDLDRFKNVNDTFGHASGDAILVQAVRAIASAIRQGDLLARSGGDEFVLILPRTTASAARTVAERVRAGIDATRFRLRRDLPPIRLTASIGVAVAEHGAADREALRARADDNLYTAKEAGRNRVVL